MKRGLILEGGAMRGLFSAGVMDAMMDAGLRPDGIVGVSAGAAFGCNYKSGQRGRAIRYNKRFARDPRYCGVGSLLRSGDIFNAEFAYHVVPSEYDVFDSAAFEADPMAYYVVATDVTTGNAVYHKCTEGGHPFFEWVRASASMPLVSRVVEIDGLRLLDGGISDSISLRFMERLGYDANVVILTQPLGYVKRPLRAMPLIRLALRRYPRLVGAMAARPAMYNAQTAYVADAEARDGTVVIRPDYPLPIGHLSHNPDDMERVYQIGYDAGLRHIDTISALWAEG